MGKTCFVTGGSSGIGKGIALAFAALGHEVVFVHLHDDRNADAVIEEMQCVHGVTGWHKSVDLSQPSGPGEAFEFALKKLGHIDVLVNNAGITRYQSALELQVETMDHLYSLNYRAPLLLMHLVAQHMVEIGIPGSIIFTASTRGFRAYPGDAVYGGLKAALVRSAESAALDLAPHGIRVNCIAPGAIQVRDSDEANVFYHGLGQRIPLGRVGMPQDVAQAAVWLASDGAAYVTGTTVRVDGGLILPGMPERVAANQSTGWGR